MSKPNILLVVWDAVRHDVCSCYGHTLPTTPVLDRLAQEGVLFERAIAAAPWTLPAISSIFTGMYPGQTNIYLQRALDQQIPTLAECFSQHGYATFGITNNDWLSRDFGLQRGFEQMIRLWQIIQTDDDITGLTVIEEMKQEEQALGSKVMQRTLRGSVLKNMINAAYHKLGWNWRDYGAARTRRPLVRWIEAQKKPWFAFVHYLEPHLQYRPPWRFVKQFARDPERCRRLMKADQWRLCWRHNAGVELLSEADLQAWHDLYIAEVAYTDYRMGEVIGWLRETGRLDETVIVVTADHGENLGDHGLVNHSYSVHEPLIHVPLIIRYPEIFAPLQRIKPLVQTIDLLATLLDMAGLPIPDGVPSQTLVGLRPQRDYALSEYGIPVVLHAAAMTKYGLTPAQLKHRQQGLTALQVDHWKLIVDTEGGARLYNLQTDPIEQYNLAQQEPAQLATMQQRLTQCWHDLGIPGVIGAPAKYMDVSAEVEQRLQALGYLD